eukprot:gene9024-biopygen16696
MQRRRVHACGWGGCKLVYIDESEGATDSGGCRQPPPLRRCSVRSSCVTCAQNESVQQLRRLLNHSAAASPAPSFNCVACSNLCRLLHHPARSSCAQNAVQHCRDILGAARFSVSARVGSPGFGGGSGTREGRIGYIRGPTRKYILTIPNKWFPELSVQVHGIAVPRALSPAPAPAPVVWEQRRCLRPVRPASVSPHFACLSGVPAPGHLSALISLMEETVEDASGTRPFLHVLSCGTRPRPFPSDRRISGKLPPGRNGHARVRSASGPRPVRVRSASASFSVLAIQVSIFFYNFGGLARCGAPGWRSAGLVEGGGGGAAGACGAEGAFQVHLIAAGLLPVAVLSIFPRSVHEPKGRNNELGQWESRIQSESEPNLGETTEPFLPA